MSDAGRAYLLPFARAARRGRPVDGGLGVDETLVLEEPVEGGVHGPEGGVPGRVGAGLLAPDPGRLAVAERVVDRVPVRDVGEANDDPVRLRVVEIAQFPRFSRDAGVRRVLGELEKVQAPRELQVVLHREQDRPVERGQRLAAPGEAAEHHVHDTVCRALDFQQELLEAVGVDDAAVLGARRPLGQVVGDPAKGARPRDQRRGTEVPRRAELRVDARAPGKHTLGLVPQRGVARARAALGVSREVPVRQRHSRVDGLQCLLELVRERHVLREKPEPVVQLVAASRRGADDVSPRDVRYAPVARGVRHPLSLLVRREHRAQSAQVRVALRRGQVPHLPPHVQAPQQDAQHHSGLGRRRLRSIQPGLPEDQLRRALVRAPQRRARDRALPGPARPDARQAPARDAVAFEPDRDRAPRLGQRDALGRRVANRVRPQHARPAALRHRAQRQPERPTHRPRQQRRLATSRPARDRHRHHAQRHHRRHPSPRPLPAPPLLRHHERELLLQPICRRRHHPQLAAAWQHR
mmetsp:Transcript_6339/g.19218  ORF Transcript_6339/g.19218 Transcript_6339/m.19218 type:complete len:523 (+) Transcript_6339:745-2313(+)